MGIIQINILILSFSLSVHTELNIEEGMKIRDIYGNDKDINGNDHDLTPHHVHVMLGVGWASYLGSWIINIAYYKFHPSAVEFQLSRSKLKLFMFGIDVFSSGKKDQPEFEKAEEAKEKRSLKGQDKHQNSYCI